MVFIASEKGPRPEIYSGNTPEDSADKRRAWSPEELAQLRQALVESGEEESRVLITEDLPADAEVQLEMLEKGLDHETDVVRHRAAKERLDLLRDVLGRVAEFLDLDSKEKIMEFALELFPFVGAAYAVTGNRLRVEKDAQTGKRSLGLEPLSWTDRGMYLLGELWASGHVIRGMKSAIVEKGAKQVALEVAKRTGQRAGENLFRRAKTGAKNAILGGGTKEKI